MKQVMFNYINEIDKKNLVTKMLVETFDYVELEDHNYIFRVSSDETSVIMDVYDNVTVNRFNRFYFSFNVNSIDHYQKEANNVFETWINVFKCNESKNIFKFAHLFTLDTNDMIKYAESFLSNEFISLLEEVLNKSTL